MASTGGRDEDNQPRARSRGLVPVMPIAEGWRRLVPRAPVHRPGPWYRAWLYLVFIVRRWLFEDRCAGQASSLTIDTLLSTVPMLGVALFFVSLLDPEDGTRLLREIFEHFIPSTRQAGESAQTVLQWAQNVTVGNLGAWGFLAALGIAFILFSTLESGFNRIWRVHRKRNLVVKFTMFYTLSTLGPLVLLYSLQQSFVSHVSENGWVAPITMAIALVLLNKLMPNTKVRWRAAVAGGIVSALLFESGKTLFTLYVQQLASRTYEGLYGPLVASLPIFVVWSFLSWLMVLLGAEIAFAVQHHRGIELQGYVNPFVRKAAHLDKASGRTAARLFLAVADSFDSRHRGITAEALAERFRLPLDRVGELLDQLESEGYVLEADLPEEGYLPARPLDTVRVSEVLALFDAEESTAIRNDELTPIFDELDHAREAAAAEVTYASLIQARRRQRKGNSADSAGPPSVRRLSEPRSERP